MRAGLAEQITIDDVHEQGPVDRLVRLLSCDELVRTGEVAAAGEGRPSPRDPLWLPPFVPHPGTSVEADERGVAYRRHGIGAAPSLSMKSTRDLLAISITTPLRTERSNPGCSAATWYTPGNQEWRRVLTHLVG